MIFFRNPLPSSGSSAVMKKNGMAGSIPRTMSRNTKPSMSPIMMSEMIAQNERWCCFRIETASSTDPTAIDSYPAFFRRAHTVSRMSFSSSSTKIFASNFSCVAMIAFAWRQKPPVDVQ